MGLFRLFSKKKRPEQNEEESNPSLEPELDAVSWRHEKKKEQKKSAKLNTHTERMGYVKDNCEIIIESGRQIEEAKVEYTAVTSYLTDMQKIDMIPEDRKLNLEEAARKILNLTKERGKLQNKSSIISDRMYRLYESYEKQIPKELRAIRDAEEYQAVIQQDMKHLEKERIELDDEQEEIISKQAFLKGIAVVTSVIVIILFLLFSLLSNYSEANFTIPFLLTVLMGMGSALYIFLEARKNSGSIRLVQMKQNRQIMLMNKVKIKSVNNRNYLDYSYSKYMVNDYEQFNIAWEEYVRMKDEARRYQSNTELLEFFHDELVHELKKFGIVDSEIWIYQPSAILDNKEMVEVRHRLNVRRQKLRDRIDMNNQQKEDALTAIRQVMKNYPDCVSEAEKLLRRYRIEVEE
ncbi:MAG: putative rane protein [Firmicutes bacterium]|nr:putative rane protein [Bacillota bacterium]